jgi:hypothetical protein
MGGVFISKICHIFGVWLKALSCFFGVAKNAVLVNAGWDMPKPISKKEKRGHFGLEPICPLFLC